MQKLRKMLGDIESSQSAALMRLIETQSKKTLAAWAVSYAKENYLEIYESRCPEDLRLREAVSACEGFLKGLLSNQEIKSILKETRQIAQNQKDDPIAQAAARAVSTACGTLQTPTNAYGFLFYGAAAVSYSKAGLDQRAEKYDQLAEEEFEKALCSLRQAAIPDEAHPAKIKWNC